MHLNIWWRDMTSIYWQYYLYTHVEFTIITEDSCDSLKYRNPCSTSTISVSYTLCVPGGEIINIEMFLENNK